MPRRGHDARPSTSPCRPPRNGQDRDQLLWTPEHPTLVDAARRARRRRRGGRSTRWPPTSGCGSVASAAGGSCSTAGPTTSGSVLEQGYWPESHLAAPGADALRARGRADQGAGVQRRPRPPEGRGPPLPRSGPTGSACWSGARRPAPTSSPRAPCSGWSPGVDRGRPARPQPPVHRDLGAAQRELGRAGHRHGPGAARLRAALFHLTRALDPTRPVVVQRRVGARRHRHPRRARLRVRAGRCSWPGTATTGAVERHVGGPGPQGRRACSPQARRPDAGRPALMLTEFGGV